jgi:hypothetical protein
MGQKHLSTSAARYWRAPPLRCGSKGDRIDFGRRIARLGVASAAAVVALLNLPSPLAAQTASSAAADAEDARHDALFATPNVLTPSPLSNLYATAPGLEQQLPAPQWRFNFAAPFAYNSNAEELPNNGTQTLQFGPLVNFSWATPLPGLPLRLSVSGFADTTRFANAPNQAEARLGTSDNDRLGGNVRLQYVDPNNDQSFSPYIVFAPRWEFLPTFSELLESRQDINVGFNKTFNFDGAFRRVPFSGDSSAATVWSFGLTVFGQERLRDPTLNSQAIYLIPSVSYVISKDWNVSLDVEFLSRWYDTTSSGFDGHEWEALPIGTLEYVIPASFFGGDRVATIFGRPAIDFQASYLKVWSNFQDVSFDQWTAGVAIKGGWRF